jgi:hypothetical protein
MIVALRTNLAVFGADANCSVGPPGKTSAPPP